MEAAYPGTDEGWFCVSRVGLIPDCTAHADCSGAACPRESSLSVEDAEEWYGWNIMYEYWDRHKNCFACVSMVTLMVPTIHVTSCWIGCITGQHPVYIVLWELIFFFHEKERRSLLSHFRMRETMEKEMPFLAAEETDPEPSFKGKNVTRLPKNLFNYCWLPERCQPA